MNKPSKDFITKLFSLVIDHPWWVLLPILIVTLLAGSQLSKFKFLTDLESILPYDEVYQDDKRIKETFNIKEFMIIGVENEENIFNSTTFKYLRGLISKIELIEGVFKTRSLFSEDNIKSISEESLDISPFIKEIDAESLKDSVEQLRNFEAVQGILVSKDFTLTTILLEIEEDADKSRVYFEIKNILEKEPPPYGEKIYLSGMPVFEGVLGGYMLQDLLVMIPIASVVITVFLYFTYRSVLLVGVSLMVVLLVNIWTLGLMALLGQPLYTIQGAMPVILMALSVADEIHIFGRFFEEHKNSSTSIKEKILVVMQEMWRPVVLTSITTACGFLALIMTSMKPLQSFGVFTAFGIMVAMILALFLTPVVLKKYGEKWSYNASHTVIDNFLLTLGRFMFRNRFWIRITIAILIFISVIGMSMTFMQDSWISNFKKLSVVYLDDVALNDKMSGTNIVYVELDTKIPDGIKNPDFLRRVVDFQRSLKSNGGIGGSISIAQIIEKMHLEFTGENAIPDSYKAIAQYMLLLDGSTHERFWDYPYQKANVIIFGKIGDYLSWIPVLNDMKCYLTKNLPDIKATFGGKLFLSRHSTDIVRTDQIKSFSTSLILIFLVSAMLFWSFKKGLIVLAPVILAVLMSYAILGFCKIPISTSVSIFSSVILGIGIDYAIHLQSKFDFLRGKMEISEVMPNIFMTAGKAILWNAVVVIAGFLILLLSEMPPNQRLGLVCSLGIATSLIACFLLVPALVSIKK